MNEWQMRVEEIIDKYQPDLLYFDNGINNRSMDPWKLRIARYYYNSASHWGKDVSVQSKSNAYLAGSIQDYERESRAPKELSQNYWQVDDPIGNKFGYVVGLKLQNADGIIRNLVENICRNGNLCLNVSPMADGTIPADQQEVLLRVGKWLERYGDGVYGTRAYSVFGEGPNVEGHPSENNIRFTCKGDT
ncbi:MAG: alpha-L-fucosidase, partial [Prevotella sp.]|nr:alpha-L-fucosidase [Prevotella sp.]